MAYMLRIRFTDADEWGPPTPFTRRKDRDQSESFIRVVGGVRTHAWKETKREERERLASEAAEATA